MESIQLHDTNLLNIELSRTSKSLRMLAYFQREQLKSYALSSNARLIQWLTLQNYSYFLGGRAASELLSTAYIGEWVSFIISIFTIKSFSF